MARPVVVLLSARGTLRGLGPACRSAGLALHRFEAIRFRPTGARPPTLVGLRPFQVLVVTSRQAAGPGLRGWLRRRGPAPLEVWAAGPGTARRLRALGFHRVRSGRELGARGIVTGLGARPRSVLHVRSEQAGPELAAALRARGHTVVEAITYRVVPSPGRLRRLPPSLRRAAAVVLTSPSAVGSLRATVGARPLRTIGRVLPAVVLGERTARAARNVGFRSVALAGTTDPQRFARLLVRTVRHAGR